jgi:DNA-binding NarL/FixJ family response regulator
MRFLVVNSDAERREGLKALLRQIDRHARFNDAQDWRQADRTLRRQHPDLLLIDWQEWMSIADARSLLADHPSLPAAVLTDDTSPDGVRDLVDQGVLGVIPRTIDPRLIVRALEIVLLGGHYIPADVLALEAPSAADVIARRLEGTSPQAKRARFVGGLSPRQEQILRCVHMGSTNKMIARALGISEGTVKIHLASVFQQLGAPNRAAAVAIYNGWLTAQLEVLRASQEGAVRPVLGEPGVVPLRRRAEEPAHYPLPANDTAIVLPMAAEAVEPYDAAAAEPTADADAV